MTPLPSTTLAAAILPAALTIPLAAITMLLIAAHLIAMHKAADRIPPSRLRVRTANGIAMLLLCPLLVAGFSLTDHDDPQTQQAFLLSWLASMGLLGLILLLTAIDMLNNARLAAKARQNLREEMIEIRKEIARAQQEQ